MQALNLIEQGTIFDQVHHVKIAIISQRVILQWAIAN